MITSLRAQFASAIAAVVIGCAFVAAAVGSTAGLVA